MLTFYESDESIILTDGKLVTKTYYHRPSIHSRLVEEYFKDYKCPQRIKPFKHHCYVFNNEFYTREQLLQLHPHLFI